MKNKAYEISDLSLSYDKKNKIVNNVTLSIEQGDFVSIIGPNGSGKSTLLRSMAKILKSSNGIIRYNSKLIYKSWKYILLNALFKFYKLPLDNVVLENNYNIDLNKSISSDKKECVKHYFLSKYFLDAKNNEFIDGDVLFSHNKIDNNSILFTKRMILENITFDKNCTANELFDFFLNKFDEENEIVKKIIFFKSEYELKKINLDNIFYLNDISKRLLTQKYSKKLIEKKIDFDETIFDSKKNFFIEDFQKNSYITHKLNKLFNFARKLGFKNGDELCRFNKIYFTNKEYSKNVAFIPQITNFPSDVTVEEFVWMGRYPHMKFMSNKKVNIEKVNDAIKAVNLWDMKDKYLDELSGGQKQRAIIALALAQDTKTILLDEPTNHLDIKHQLEIIHLLHHLNHDSGKTIILVIHDINHGMKFSDKIIVMNHGEIVTYGSTNEVINEKIIKDVFGVDANVVFSQNKKIISDYWIDDLDPLSKYGD